MALTGTERSRRWREKNKEKHLEYTRRYRQENKERIREKRRGCPKEAEYRRNGLARRYATMHNITVEQAEALLQTTHCQICGVELTVGRNATARCIDHSHETGEVRGVICSSCNKMLGFAKDNPEVLLRAAQYLTHPQEAQ